MTDVDARGLRADASRNLAKLAGSLDAAVGPFDGFDGDGGTLLDGDGLPHVEAAHLLGEHPAELHVFQLGGAGAAPGQYALGHEQLRAIVEGRGERHPIPLELGDHAEEDRIVALVSES